MRAAMGAIGLGPQVQADAIAVLAGVLHMGNVRFRPDGADEYAAVDDEGDNHQAMGLCSRLMGCEDVSSLVLQVVCPLPPVGSVPPPLLTSRRWCCSGR